MLEPIIGFSIFFAVISLIIYSGNKSRQKQYDDIKTKLGGRTDLFIEQTKCSTMTWGLKNNNYLFNKCDIYLTDNSIIILGHTKNSIIKQLSTPIILTDKITEVTIKLKKLTENEKKSLIELTKKTVGNNSYN